MKALIRNDGETITDNMHIAGIDWNTGAPLTDRGHIGGPYTMVCNYVPPVNDEPAQYEEVIVEEEEDEIPHVEEEDDYVFIGGVRYTKEELRKLIE